MPSPEISDPESAHDGDEVGEKERKDPASDMISTGEPRVFVPLVSFPTLVLSYFMA